MLLTPMLFLTVTYVLYFYIVIVSIVVVCIILYYHVVFNFCSLDCDKLDHLKIKFK